MSELQPLGLQIALRSGSPPAARVDCLIVDTTGELRDWYRIATIVFIGKSLTARGGQNPVEAVEAGKPVIFGPHMENFSGIVRSLLSRNAAIQVADAEDLKRTIRELLRDVARREQMSLRAREALVPHRQATERTAAILATL